MTRINFFFKPYKDICVFDRELRKFERELIKSIFCDIVKKAKELGYEYFETFSLPHFTSQEQALEYRYLYVPVLYKLGMTREASFLAQKTFEYCFPQ